jgi:hypothetical protein
MNEVLAEIQRRRILALMLRLASYADIEEDPGALLILGLTVGLQLAALHPAAAAMLLDEMDPPSFETSLRWVVYGTTEVDPSMPVN